MVLPVENMNHYIFGRERHGDTQSAGYRHTICPRNIQYIWHCAREYTSAGFRLYAVAVVELLDV